MPRLGQQKTWVRPYVAVPTPRINVPYTWPQMRQSPLFQPQFHAASDQSLLVYLGDRISLDTHRRLTNLLGRLHAKPIAGVRNLHPAYTSLLIDFDALQFTHAQLESVLLPYLDGLDDTPAAPA